jgi:tetratricopeptide (TPR) repeat protein
MKELFLAALAVAPAGRPAWLERECSGDAELRRRVELILAAHDTPQSLLDRLAPAADPPGGATDAVAGEETERAEVERETPGTLLAGRYKLVEAIGEGGMGTVWMARQTEPVRRLVAVKLIKPGMDSEHVLARFGAERQALALMDHPNIAKVLDGGQASDGRPYFVMDLVKGLPITDYCDQAQLTPRQRLELFVDVCRAVQHAHHKGIIHRDLKPSNVLVTLHDGAALVKVIDFGIAKALAQPLTERTVITGFAQLVGTPLYMSPEQAALSNDDVDTRSDVYSLGVLLYELLTGTTPFDRERFKEVGYDEMRRIIREEEPPRPSTRVSTLGRAATTVSAQRQSDPKRLSRLFRGELDWIVMRALEKDRNRRYETANAFAMDVQRYLAEEPVQACPPSAWYRFRKFARRNRTPLAVAACYFLVFAILGGSIGWAWHSRAAREKEESARQAEIVHHTEESLSAVRALLAENNLTQVRQKLAEANAHLGKDRTVYPELAAQIEAFEAELNRFEKYLGLVDRAHQAEISPSRELVSLKDSSHGVAGHAWERTPAKAVPILLDALALYDLLERDEGPNLEGVLLGQFQVEQIRRTAYEELLWLADDVLGRRQGHRSGRTLSEKAAATQALDYLHKAEVVQRPTRAFFALRGRCHELLGEGEAARADVERADKTPPTTALDHYLQGLAAFAAGRRALAIKDNEAVAKYKNLAIDQFEAALGLEPTHYWSLMRLGYCLASLGQTREDLFAASTVFTGCISKRPGHAHAYQCRADVYHRLGRDVAALADCSRAIDLDAQHLLAWNTRGEIYIQLRQYEKAIADFSAAIALDPEDAEAWFMRAWAHDLLEKFEEAIADYTRGLKLDPKDAKAWHNRGTNYHRRHQYEQAIADFSTAIELDKTLALAWNNRGDVYLHLKQYQNAIADYSEAIKLAPRTFPPVFNRGSAYFNLQQYKEAVADFSTAIELDPNYALAYYNLGNALREQGKLDDAITAFRKAIELDPKDAKVHTNLGVALYDQRKLDEAIVAYRNAIELDPNHALAHYNLGNALRDLKKPDEAIVAYRNAIKLDPNDAKVYINLGNVLLAQRKLPEAEAAYRRAIELDPNHALAYHNLGVAVREQGRLDDAITAFRKAIELDPKHALAYYSLGNTLRDQKKPAEAVTAFHTAIELAPGFAEAHCNLGHALRDLGQFAQALTALQRGHELGSPRPDWRYPSARWVQECEPLLALDKRLPEVLQGAAATPAERVSLAGLCLRYKQRYADAALLYGQAFAAEAKLAEDLNNADRYNAACAAVLAAGGQGIGAEKLNAADKSRLRGQALDWLRADLTGRDKLLADKPAAAGPIQGALRRWLDDPDLAGVRDPKKLAELPPEEREGWLKLWGDVRDLLRRAEMK